MHGCRLAVLGCAVQVCIQLLGSGGTAHALTIHPPSGAPLRFGFAVSALGGDALISAAPGGADGAVYLFDATNAVLLHSFDRGGSTNFGWTVLGVGNTALVGSTGGSIGKFFPSGSAKLFDAGTGALLASCAHDETFSDAFGSALATLGTNLVVGAPEYGWPGPIVGAVFVCDAVTGAQVQALVNLLGTDGSQFGAALAVAAGNLIVGAPGEGRVYIIDPTIPTIIRTLTAPDGGGFFGASLAAAGNQVVVAAPGKFVGGASAVGAVYLYDASSGDLLHTIDNPAPSAFAQFGSAVAALGTNVLVGSPGDDTAGTNAGAVYLFDASTGALIWSFMPPAGSDGAGFGSAVAALGGDALIGAPNNGNGVAYIMAPFCGNGVLDPGEACDDGNSVDGDCCSATCRLERGTCAPPGADAALQIRHSLLRADTSLLSDTGAIEIRGIFDDSTSTGTLSDALLANAVSVAISDAAQFTDSIQLSDCVGVPAVRLICRNAAGTIRASFVRVHGLRYRFVLKVRHVPETNTGVAVPTAPVHIAFHYGTVDRVASIGPAGRCRQARARLMCHNP